MRGIKGGEEGVGGCNATDGDDLFSVGADEEREELKDLFSTRPKGIGFFSGCVGDDVGELLEKVRGSFFSCASGEVYSCDEGAAAFFSTEGAVRSPL